VTFGPDDVLNRLLRLRTGLACEQEGGLGSAGGAMGSTLKRVEQTMTEYLMIAVIALCVVVVAYVAVYGI
jgi:hypothetical protein